MGNREDLLAGARRCLLEKGYARTTARDIAAASGVSLAAIGYHFNGKQALLHEAFGDILREWGDGIERAFAGHSDLAVDPRERFELTWDEIVASFTETRPLWTLQLEVVSRIGQDPELGRTFAEASRQARLGLVEMFGMRTDHPEADRVGNYLQMLLVGSVVQWFTDPATTLSGRELLETMRNVVATMDESGQA